jgi:hypothetical protein
MILSDRETRAALIRPSIRITPDPRLDPDVWSSTALDLRLYHELLRWVFPPQTPVLFHPNAPDYDFKAMLEQYGETIIIPPEGYVVRPGEFYLGGPSRRFSFPTVRGLLRVWKARAVWPGWDLACM